MTLAQLIPTAADRSAQPSPSDLSPVWMPDSPLVLRPHNVLCLQGWQGLGYSLAFTATMDAVYGQLAADPTTFVTLHSGPDTLCVTCPINTVAGCGHDVTEGGWITALDAATIARLDLQTGVAYPWSTILDAIAASFRGADLATHCARCCFQPLGLCADGLERLRAKTVPVLLDSTVPT